MERTIGCELLQNGDIRDSPTCLLNPMKKSVLLTSYMNKCSGLKGGSSFLGWNPGNKNVISCFDVFYYFPYLFKGYLQIIETVATGACLYLIGAGLFFSPPEYSVFLFFIPSVLPCLPLPQISSFPLKGLDLLESCLQQRNIFILRDKKHQMFFRRPKGKKKMRWSNLTCWPHLRPEWISAKKIKIKLSASTDVLSLIPGCLSHSLLQDVPKSS